MIMVERVVVYYMIIENNVLESLHSVSEESLLAHC